LRWIYQCPVLSVTSLCLRNLTFMPKYSWFAKHEFSQLRNAIPLFWHKYLVKIIFLQIIQTFQPSNICHHLGFSTIFAVFRNLEDDVPVWFLTKKDQLYGVIVMTLKVITRFFFVKIKITLGRSLIKRPAITKKI